MSLLLKGGLALTERGIERKDIYIEGGRIVELSSREADHVINIEGMVAIPGLINLHTHMSMNYLRGFGDDKRLEAWLEEDIWPREKKLTARLAYLTARLGIKEALQFGTTSFLSMYFFGEEVERAANELGVRAWVGEATIDFFDEDRREQEIKKTRKWLGRQRGLVTRVSAPHSTYTCSTELLRESHRLAEEAGSFMTTHIAETREEVRKVQKLTGKTPFRHLAAIGAARRTVMAHGVWLSPVEARRAAREGASVAHCPTSNLKLGSGMAPVRRYIAAGLTVGLGTDGQASNNSLDMLREVKMAALLQKLKNVEFPSLEALKMATSYGARALGFEGGIIGEGRPADIAVIDLRKPHFHPIAHRNQIISHLVYSASGSDVAYTIVNGQVVYDGKVEMEELPEIEGLMEKLGLTA